jgi:hypothetical protein
MDDQIKSVFFGVAAVLVIGLIGYGAYKKVYAESGKQQGETLLLATKCTELESDAGASVTTIRQFLKEAHEKILAIEASDFVVKENSKAVDNSVKKPKAAGDALSECVEQLKKRLPEAS